MAPMTPLLLALALSPTAMAQEDPDMWFDDTPKPYNHVKISERIAKPDKPGPAIWPAGVPERPPVTCNMQVYVSRHGETVAVRIELCPADFRATARSYVAAWKHEPVQLGGGIKSVWYPVDVIFNHSQNPPPKQRDPSMKVAAGEAIVAEEMVKRTTTVLPGFPKPAREAGIVEAICEVRIHADLAGDTTDIGFERCHELFHEEVIGAAAQWTHEPIVMGREATPFTYVTTLTLRDDSAE